MVEDEGENNIQDGDEGDKGGETGAGDIDPVKTVNDKLGELKEANDKIEKEMLRGEQLRAKIALGGKSESGQAPIKPKDETDKEYRARIEKEMAEGKKEW